MKKQALAIAVLSGLLSIPTFGASEAKPAAPAPAPAAPARTPAPAPAPNNARPSPSTPPANNTAPARTPPAGVAPNQTNLPHNQTPHSGNEQDLSSQITKLEQNAIANDPEAAAAKNKVIDLNAKVQTLKKQAQNAGQQ